MMVTSNFTTIPIIDVAPLLAKCDDPNGTDDKDLLEVVAMLDEACRGVGFFYLKGHGVPDSLVRDVRDSTRSFFRLQDEEKLKIKLTSKSGFRGYQLIKENITKGLPDLHEAIDLYKEIEPGMYGQLGTTLVGSNQWPENPTRMKSVMEKYVDLLKEVSRKIMRGIALALGGPVDTFEQEQMAGDQFWVMRLIGYPGSNSNSKNTDSVGCGAHTDYGLLTLVNQDESSSALEVKNQNDEWISAVPIPGTFVCNIGDMLQVWSNGEYRSTVHRVIVDSPKYRVSVPFFYEPNFDAAVEPLEFCKSRNGGVARFEKVVYGEHLVRKVLTNFVSYDF
ncbi:2-oxoglutarate (2OG) and Fe(II)-dependent oxygenase superfamilyprotein [Zostera marina]|uniref:2-oxoglutarate (2OG) and Fe(II)-dependent oxygenase superfamilyprotein n=1 Tax=Zostera marina TaxID=29655 RepID=A0A0K9PT33_ZOSMR|nr:2-oxoglutarate (2OG) and Fe(II)-dependent oxygenase superfamilyprotein [Zostera marina]